MTLAPPVSPAGHEETVLQVRVLFRPTSGCNCLFTFTTQCDEQIGVGLCQRRAVIALHARSRVFAIPNLRNDVLTLTFGLYATHYTKAFPRGS